MNELLLKRLERRLANLPDEQGYQVLDYVEFLETKYGTADRTPTPLERFTDGVEDALRAGRIPAAAIRGTMGAVDSASRLMERLAEAGRAAVAELGRSVAPPPSEPAAPEEAERAPPAPPADGKPEAGPAAPESPSGSA